MTAINMGILGAGNIADHMARTITRMPDVTPYAVASRDADKSKVFAQKYGFAKNFGSYKEMLEDPNVNLVYVATPHSHHFEHASLCLEHGKHVLCEKAFTATAPQAEKLIALAQDKKLLITEALWTRYMPFQKTINKIVSDGTLGEVSTLTANLGYDIKKKERILNPALAGGALLDLTVYPLNFAFMVFGSDFERIASSCQKFPTGMDCQDSVTLHYADGRMAQLFTSAMGVTDRRGVIFGDKGYLVVENINNPQSAQLFSPEWKVVESYTCPPQISGYEYEVEAAVKAIREGRLECPEMPHAETLRVMRLLDALRAEWGVEFAC